MSGRGRANAVTRAKAIELRRSGMVLETIAAECRVAVSTVWSWTRDVVPVVPVQRAPRGPMTDEAKQNLSRALKAAWRLQRERHAGATRRTA